MTSVKTHERTGSEVGSEPVIDIIHFADPFCWWSWGLEPILHRLKEVYGDQIEVTYRMGGMADKNTGDGYGHSAPPMILL